MNHTIVRRHNRLLDDSGAATAEYAIATLATVSGLERLSERVDDADRGVLAARVGDRDVRIGRDRLGIELAPALGALRPLPGDAVAAHSSPPPGVYLSHSTMSPGRLSGSSTQPSSQNGSMRVAVSAAVMRCSMGMVAMCANAARAATM